MAARPWPDSRQPYPRRPPPDPLPYRIAGLVDAAYSPRERVCGTPPILIAEGAQLTSTGVSTGSIGGMLAEISGKTCSAGLDLFVPAAVYAMVEGGAWAWRALLEMGGPGPPLARLSRVGRTPRPIR